MSKPAPVASIRVEQARRIASIVQGREVMDGAGVRIQRLLTQELQQRLDPFLLLDAFRSDDPQDYIAGFPDHPHRGFETITYMIQGRMRHRDSAGHEGLLDSGGVQWMTAGRGVIHSEMPEQENGRMEGFQLWLNLPAQDKLMAPGYRDIAASEIPEFTTVENVLVRVIAGESHGVRGAVQRPHSMPLYLDVHLPAGASYNQPLPLAHNVFLHVYRGAVNVVGDTLQAGQLAILDNDPAADGVSIAACADEDSRLLLIAGQPLNEPIVQHGPFVMNSAEEIRQAFADYRAGRFAR
jgi:redox-sensitive bicupin YhaK (pirin superfamily)